LALPVGYMFARQMLQQFAYAIKISVFDGLISLFAALLTAIITVFIHAYRAAISNPVNALKND